jgi:hypothetical protein
MDRVVSETSFGGEIEEELMQRRRRVAGLDGRS